MTVRLLGHWGHKQENSIENRLQNHFKSREKVVRDLLMLKSILLHIFQEIRTLLWLFIIVHKLNISMLMGQISKTLTISWRKRKPLVREMCSLPVFPLNMATFYCADCKILLQSYCMHWVHTQRSDTGKYRFRCPLVWLQRSHLHVYSGKYMFINMNYALNTPSFTNLILFVLLGVAEKILIYTVLLQIIVLY